MHWFVASVCEQHPLPEGLLPHVLRPDYHLVVAIRVFADVAWPNVEGRYQGAVLPDLRVPDLEVSIPALRGSGGP